MFGTSSEDDPRQQVQNRGVQSADRSWGYNFETGESTMKI